MKIIKEEKEPLTKDQVIDSIIPLTTKVRKLAADMAKFKEFNEAISLCNEFASKISSYIRYDTGHENPVTNENINVNIDTAKDESDKLKDIMDKTESEVTLTETYTAQELLRKRKLDEAIKKNGYILEKIIK